MTLNEKPGFVRMLQGVAAVTERPGTETTVKPRTARVSVLFLELLLCSLLPVASRAQSSTGNLVYSTYAGYCSACGLTIGAANGNIDYTQADQFSPSASGPLDHIDVAIGVVNGTSPANLYILTDNGDTPGSVLESFQIALGPTYGTQGIHLAATSALHPQLVAGQKYWLMGTRANPNEQAIWNTNPGIASLRAESWTGSPGGALHIGPYQALVFDVYLACVSGGPCIISPSDGAHPQSEFVALSGTGTPNDQLSILVGGAPIGQVQVDSEGSWEALPDIAPYGSSVTIQVQDLSNFDTSNTITVHPLSSTLFFSLLPPSVYTQMLPLRKADIFIDQDPSSPQVFLYGANYTHAAIYLGGGSDGTPLVAEAVTAQEAGIWGQVRSLPLEQSLLWKATRLAAFRPKSFLPGAKRSAIVSWAKTITAQGLPYWSQADLLVLIPAADSLYLAGLPQRLNLFLNRIFALTNSTSTFICSTLVWRAYYEGTGHTQNIAEPNLMSAQAGSLLGALSPGFINLLRQPPPGCAGCATSTFIVPETFARNTTLLSQIF